MRIVLFLCLLASFSFGQQMKFKYEGDTLFVGLLKCDKEVRVFCKFPEGKNLEGYFFKINFPDGSFDLYQPVYRNGSYAEFSVSDVKKLSKQYFDYISFECAAVSEPCTNVKTKDFFTKFLKEL